ncbi:MAG: formylglycine-generating enzyme family protein, partial [Ferruginibacter sp.]|nr:formylglycine-generating enzyme family protein [Ferruginibacter sp.]
MKKIFVLHFGLLSCLATMAQTQLQKFENYPQTVPASEYKFTMVPIKTGNFMMGSKATEAGRKTDEGPQVKVAIAAFW